MERRLFVLRLTVITMVFSLVACPLFAQNDKGGAPSSEQMIKQRLQSDIEELKKENEQLRKQVRRLKNNSTTESTTKSPSHVDALKKENERLRNLLSRYRQLFKEFVGNVQKIDEIYKNEVGDGKEISGESIRESAASKGDKWIQESDRPYPIRREPLQEEITYTTDPDDTLSKLAHQFYHDAELWIRIYLVNEDRLDSPDSLPPGTKLRLPPIDRIKQ